MPLPSDYRELAPSWRDARRIEAVWSFTSSSPGRHQVLPDGRMDLVVGFRSKPSGRITDPAPMIVGPSRSTTFVPMQAGDQFLGLRFRPGWGGACLGLDPTEHRDSVIVGTDLARILEGKVAALREAKSVPQLLDALAAVGRRCVSHSDDHEVPPAVAHAIDLLLLSGGRMSIGDVAAHCGMPERSLRRSLEQAIGMPAKALAGVLRFQRTVRLLARPSSGAFTLAHAALEGGYSDQAHMTREFQRYGRFTPARRPLLTLVGLPLPLVAETFKNPQREWATLNA